MALKMVETGKNPNVEARRVAASEFTLGMALERYRTHLTTRTQKPAKVETLKVHDRVVRRFTEWKWIDKKLSDFSTEEISKKFNENKALATANEQRFRWVIAAINWNIDREKFDAHAANRQPLLDKNLFEILVHDKMFRDQTQLDKEREEKSKRSFFNHTAPNVTATYTKAEWELLRSWMTRIEQAILATAPNVYNSLKPLDWPPLPAPDPHVCMLAKPRTGRPRKDTSSSVNPDN